MSEETRKSDGHTAGDEALMGLEAFAAPQGAAPFPAALSKALGRRRAARRVKAGLWLGPCLAALALLPLTITHMWRGSEGADSGLHAGGGAPVEPLETPGVREEPAIKLATQPSEARPHQLTVVSVAYYRGLTRRPDSVTQDVLPMMGGAAGSASPPGERVTPLSREAGLLSDL
jgi:hypothetical protein